MINVIFCGILGFFCYDAMRVYVVYVNLKVNETFFCGWIGIFVRLVAFIAAGLIGAAASLDLFLLRETPFFADLNVELSGAYVRAFALGVAGPAGLSKWDSSAGIEGPQSEQTAEPGTRSLDSLEWSELTLKKQFVFAVRRLLLR